MVMTAAPALRLHQHLAVHAPPCALVQQQHPLPPRHVTCNTSSGSNSLSPLAAPSSCRKRRMLSLRPSGACPCGWPLCCCARRNSRLCCKAALLSRCCCAPAPLADRRVAADCRPVSAGAPACSALPMAASSRFTAAWMTCEAGCSRVRELHAAPEGGCCLSWVALADSSSRERQSAGQSALQSLLPLHVGYQKDVTQKEHPSGLHAACGCHPLMPPQRHAPSPAGC